MRKTLVRLASKLLTLALLVGCLSVIAPSRAANANGWVDCWSDWSWCMQGCDPTNSGFDQCWDGCDWNLWTCELNTPSDAGGFKIWP